MFHSTAPTTDRNQKVGPVMEQSDHSVGRTFVKSEIQHEVGMIKTACYPREFKLTCERFSISQKKAVEEMGFGSLLKIGCLHLNRDLCQTIIDNLEAEGEMLVIKFEGRSILINCSDFARVMGLKNGGASIVNHTSDVVDDPELGGLKKCLQNDEVVGESLKNALCKNQVADDGFRKLFLLYCLFILLCPSRPDKVEKKIVAAVSDTTAIGEKNWARFCFQHLLQGVVDYKKKRCGFIKGCMVFLQLFIFDLIVDATVMRIVKTVDPIVSWTSKNCKKMIKWMRGDVGMCSILNPGSRNRVMLKGCCKSKEIDLSEQVRRAMEGVECIENEVCAMKCLVDNLEDKFDEATKVLCEVEKIAVNMSEVVVRRVILEAAGVVFDKAGNTGLLSSQIDREGKGEYHTSKTDGEWKVEYHTDTGMDHTLFNYGGCHSPIIEEVTDKSSADATEEDMQYHDWDNLIGSETLDDPCLTSQNGAVNDNLVFPFSGEMSDTNLQLMRFLFGQCEGRAEDMRLCRDIIIRCGELVMTKGDLSCLRPGNPITRKLIDLCAAYLYEENSSSWFLPTNFNVLSNDGPNQLGGGRTLSQIISECSLHRFNRRLKLCCKIFIPVQDGVPGQWFLIVIKLKDKVVEIWDTSSDPFPMRRRHELATSVVQLVQKVFASDMKKPGDIYYNIENFDFCARSYEAVFCGEHDSGVCLIRNMQSYGEPWFEGFQSNKQRTEIALGIVSNQKNEQLKSVDVAAVLTLRALVAEQEGVPENYNDTRRNERKGPTGRKLRSHRKRKDRA